MPKRVRNLYDGFEERWLLVLLLSLAMSVGASPARACKVSTPRPFMTDAAQSADQVAPTLPPPSLVGVERGRGPTRSGCGGTTASSTCDRNGRIEIGLAATDDLTPVNSIGYRLSVASGGPPAGLTLPTGPVLPTFAGGQMWLYWDDDARDDQESFDFALQIVALDLAGNESTPQTLRIAHPGH